ncbi:MAG: CaiB/BaiF CoA-transferase family protein [Dehalococcoidia bacterium]|jgi:crotonobetainyl-CoA:carnitine CoA-transferase CaiB-like acyl-CoA transferase
MSPQALEGIKILDLAWLGPGPFCSFMLGDLGADIIKVFDANPAKRGGPVMMLFDSSRPGLRNCRNMGLDLKSDAGKQVFRDMVKSADVVMEGFRPGVVKRLGVDYDTLKQINPKIVYASLSGYGQDGPYRDMVGHDINYISYSGLLGLTGQADGKPALPGSVIGDFTGGMSAAIGILAALVSRGVTGKGQYIDMSMTDAVVELTSMQINPHLFSHGDAPRRGDTMFTGHFPWYNVYETKDGKYISIGALEPWFFGNLCQLLGLDEFIPYEFDEGEKRKEMFEAFRKKFLTKTRDEWVSILKQKDTCVAPVLDVDEMENDPHLVARNMIMESDHPVHGKVKQVGSMHKLSDSPMKVRNWSTKFGEHTDEIMRELGYDDARIAELRKAEVIG